MVGRSPLATTPLKWVLRFAEACQWQTPSPQFRAFLEAMFMGINQTKIVEDSMGVLRDAETRDSPSKKIAHFAEWQSTVGAKLLDSFGRGEVEPCTAAPLDRAHFSDDVLFQRSHKADGSLDSVDLRGITKTQAWNTYSAQSIKQRVADLELMQVLSDGGDWSLADAAWHVQLWPEGRVLVNQPRREVFLVLRVYESAALVWPMFQRRAGWR